MAYVVKWDGRKEPFKREKIEGTLLRMGAPPKVAETVSKKIEEEAYDGIKTETILEKAYKLLERYRPAVSLRKDLRSALSEIPSQPEFEEYVRIILSENGYRVSPNRMIRGFCVEHEIDGIAEKDGQKLYLEVKHHADPHTYTHFDVTLAVKAKLDDIQMGFQEGTTDVHLDNAMIVCNTRLTEHAQKYSDCVGIMHLGWNTPKGKGFEKLIEESKLYPITMLKSLSMKEKELLYDSCVLTLKHLVEQMYSIENISRERLSEIVENARDLLDV